MIYIEIFSLKFIKAFDNCISPPNSYIIKV
jgi:hypothetical protein